MTIEEYKDSILYHLEIAVDCEAVELIIYRSIEKMKEKHVHAHLISGYLNILKESLEQLSPNGFDIFLHILQTDWKSYPTMILIPEYRAMSRTPQPIKKMNNNREKI